MPLRCGRKSVTTMPLPRAAKVAVLVCRILAGEPGVDEELRARSVAARCRVQV